MKAVPQVERSRGTSPAITDIRALIYPPTSATSQSTPGVSEGNAVLLNFTPDSDRTSLTNLQADIEQNIAEESKRSFEAGRQLGMQEATAAEREAQGAVRRQEEAQRLQQLAQLIQRFDEAKERYLHAVEHEVVELALAIAARVLRREAQMDQLLLTGAVRVALGQLAESTEVSLRVPATEVDLWKEAIAYIPNLRVKTAVVSDEQMCAGECVIDTQLGSVDLGIRAQLGEIERGFFDRAGRNGLRAATKWDDAAAGEL